MLYQTLQDALFAAIAATGFAAISNPPRQAYIYCAILAACGHAFRFILMSAPFAGINIIPATLIAALTIGFLAVLMASHARFPAETCLFPSLLPMIPGIYAYKAFGGLALCLFSESSGGFTANFYLLAYNSLTCCAILLCMVVGGTLPIFILKKISFQATR